MLEPGDVLIDCTGSKSLLRDHLAPGADGRPTEREHAQRSGSSTRSSITFLYGQPYDCNEYCKYYKNVENAQYKFIPMVNRTHYDGSVSHVTGIVNITAEEYEAMPSRFDGEWLREQLPGRRRSRWTASSTRSRRRRNGEIVGDLEIVRIPLDLYRARNATSRQWLHAGPGDHPFARSPVFLAGDSAIGSPYFQSISLGFECAMFLAGLLAQRDLPLARHARSLRAATSTSSGCASTCAAR